MDNSGDGNRSGGGQGSNKRLQQTQAQVDEVIDVMKINVQKVLERDQKLHELVEHAGITLNVVGIMRTNVAKVLERDEKLSDLSERADNLQVGASRFEQQATRLKRKYWWKNLKMMIIIGVVCVVVLIIIIVAIVPGSDGGSGNPVTPTTAAPPITPSAKSG